MSDVAKKVKKLVFQNIVSVPLFPYLARNVNLDFSQSRFMNKFHDTYDEMIKMIYYLKIPLDKQLRI